MGVTNGVQTLYSLKGLTIGDVTDISRALAEEYGIFPTIDVDCSNVCFMVEPMLLPPATRARARRHGEAGGAKRIQ